MKTGVFLLGSVEMDDAGPGPPVATDRRYDQQTMWHAATRMLDMGVEAERLGFDSFWLTEHHFQYEGYEVIPNALMFGCILAERTTTIRIGALFNIVPQWHPLRLAEDFSTLHNISGGRAILGVGRGTVPREAEPLGTVIGSFDNPNRAEADQLNRERFEEAMEVIRAALDNEHFSFHGKHFDIPPPGIPDRGGTVQTLTLVPRPLYPYETWQAITSPPTLEYVPRQGWGGVFWITNREFLRRNWERFAEVYEAEHGRTLEAGEKRMLVLNVRIEDTHETAVERARPGHDEFWKFLAPYGWSKGYMGDDGRPAPAGLVPTLEQSMKQGIWCVGTAEGVAEAIAERRRELGLEHLTIVPAFPGDSYDVAAEQMARYQQEVVPLLG